MSHLGHSRPGSRQVTSALPPKPDVSSQPSVSTFGASVLFPNRLTWQRRCIVAARYRRAVMLTPFENHYLLAHSGNDDA
jgi:hypothetical protein